MTTAPARGEHGAAEAAQPSARGASTRPPPAAEAELTPGDRSDARVLQLSVAKVLRNGASTSDSPLA